MNRFGDIGKLILRVSVGVVILMHGINKLMNGFDFIQKSLVDVGLPAELWLGVPLAEIVAPLLLILGLFTRISSLLIAFTMFMSFYLVLGLNGFAINKFGGFNGELNLLLFFCTLAIFFLGAGRFALSNGKSRWLE